MNIRRIHPGGPVIEHPATQASLESSTPETALRAESVPPASEQVQEASTEPPPAEPERAREPEAQLNPPTETSSPPEYSATVEVVNGEMLIRIKPNAPKAELGDGAGGGRDTGQEFTDPKTGQTIHVFAKEGESDADAVKRVKAHHGV